MEEILGKLEKPTNNEEVTVNTILLQGWAFSKTGDELSIEILVDGKPTRLATWGLPRFDIYKKYGTDIGYDSGFMARLGMVGLAIGVHTVEVFANGSDGKKFLGKVQISRKKNPRNKSVEVAPTPLGTEPFKERGEKSLELFIKDGKLMPNHKVLEIGSGYGRMASPLSRYLKDRGEYFALEPLPNAVDYCQKNISSRFPNFHFILIDVFNDMYNKTGKYKASEYEFPFPDETFDFIFFAFGFHTSGFR